MQKIIFPGSASSAPLTNQRGQKARAVGEFLLDVVGALSFLGLCYLSLGFLAMSDYDQDDYEYMQQERQEQAELRNGLAGHDDEHRVADIAERLRELRNERH